MGRSAGKVGKSIYLSKPRKSRRLMRLRYNAGVNDNTTKDKPTLLRDAENRADTESSEELTLNQPSTTCRSPMKSLENSPNQQCSFSTEQNLPSTSHGLQRTVSEKLNTPDPTRQSFSSSSTEIEKDTNMEQEPRQRQSFNSSGSSLRSQHEDLETNFTTSSSTSEDSVPMKLGRRVVDLDFFLSQVLNGERHITDCSIADMVITGSIQKGLITIINLKCRMCGVTKSIHSERNEPKTLQVNQGVVLGAISIGIGYSQCEEFFSFLNVPFMSNQSFIASLDKVSDKIHETALKSMIEAGKEERKLAVDLGDVDQNGIPYITVIADGAWSKRSYGLNYNALSGVACIVGQRTSKLLFLGVRNKFCSVCAVAKQKSTTPKEHKCSKNWSSTSTSMEADIIVEGFKSSVESHGLKYTTLVGDGDSSVMKKLLEAKPYGMDIIKKVECRNHLYRNIFKRIREICDRPKSSSNTPVPPYLRKIIRNNCNRLHSAFKKATLFRSNEAIPFEEKMENLKGDILNAPSHVFGEHKRCQDIKYFTCVPKDGEINYVPDFKKYGIYQDIEAALYRLVQNVSSLLLNMDNNDAECFNSIVCKFTGGKRINFSKGGQYTTRCESALISANAKGKYYSIIHKGVSGHKIKLIQKRFEAKRLQRRKLEKDRRQKRRKKTIAPADEDYGAIVDEIPDMEATVYQERKVEFLQEMEDSINRRCEIERATVGQSSNPEWLQQRSCRLTASHFGEIIKTRSTSAPKKVEALLYSKFFGNKDTKYGSANEHLARQEYCRKVGKSVKNCGLFISTDFGYLAASPDGLINESGIFEVKCPSSAKEITPEDAIYKKIIKYATLEGDKLKLNRKHNYFYQVQGQLNITGRNYCDFAIWTPKGLLVETIHKDEILWKEYMLPKLEKFFVEWMLPEIIDSRKKRNLNIRGEALAV